MWTQRGDLAIRVAELDGRQFSSGSDGDLDPDVVHFIRIVSPANRPRTVSDHALPEAMSASTADALMDSCRLLRRLTARFPASVVGPLARDQFWIATGRPRCVPPRASTLDRAHFVEMTATAEIAASTNPFGVGIFTSTGLGDSAGMWWCYLRSEGSSLTPVPWKVWSLQTRQDVKVLEITTAGEWVDFVSTHALERGRLLYPDWRLAADKWDAIHMTLRAIAATQGMWLSAGERVVAAPFWDVESTLWLRWAFTAVEPVREVGARW